MHIVASAELREHSVADIDDFGPATPCVETAAETHRWGTPSPGDLMLWLLGVRRKEFLKAPAAQAA